LKLKPHPFLRSLPCIKQLFLLKKYSSELGKKRHIIPEQGAEFILYGLLADIKSNVFKAISSFSIHFSRQICSPKASRDGVLCLPQVHPEAMYLRQFAASSSS